MNNYTLSDSDHPTGNRNVKKTEAHGQHRSPEKEFQLINTLAKSHDNFN